MSLRITSAALILSALLIPGESSAIRCTVCHSKNPAMKKMHAELQGRDCFACHKIGQRLMGKGEAKDVPALLVRRGTDPLCIECHSGKSPAKP